MIPFTSNHIRGPGEALGVGSRAPGVKVVVSITPGIVGLETADVGSAGRRGGPKGTAVARGIEFLPEGNCHLIWSGNRIVRGHPPVCERGITQNHRGIGFRPCRIYGVIEVFLHLLRSQFGSIEGHFVNITCPLEGTIGTGAQSEATGDSRNVGLRNTGRTKFTINVELSYGAVPGGDEMVPFSGDRRSAVVAGDVDCGSESIVVVGPEVPAGVRLVNQPAFSRIGEVAIGNRAGQLAGVHGHSGFEPNLGRPRTLNIQGRIVDRAGGTLAGGQSSVGISGDRPGSPEGTASHRHIDGGANRTKVIDELVLGNAQAKPACIFHVGPVATPIRAEVHGPVTRTFGPTQTIVTETGIGSDKVGQESPHDVRRAIRIGIVVEIPESQKTRIVWIDGGQTLAVVWIGRPVDFAEVIPAVSVGIRNVGIGAGLGGTDKGAGSTFHPIKQSIAIAVGIQRVGTGLSSAHENSAPIFTTVQQTVAIGVVDRWVGVGSQFFKIGEAVAIEVTIRPLGEIPEEEGFPAIFETVVVAVFSGPKGSLQKLVVGDIEGRASQVTGPAANKKLTLGPAAAFPVDKLDEMVSVGQKDRSQAGGGTTVAIIDDHRIAVNENSTSVVRVEAEGIDPGLFNENGSVGNEAVVIGIDILGPEKGEGPCTGEGAVGIVAEVDVSFNGQRLFDVARSGEESPGLGDVIESDTGSVISDHPARREAVGVGGVGAQGNFDTIGNAVAITVGRERIGSRVIGIDKNSGIRLGTVQHAVGIGIRIQRVGAAVAAAHPHTCICFLAIEGTVSVRIITGGVGASRQFIFVEDRIAVGIASGCQCGEVAGQPEFPGIREPVSVGIIVAHQTERGISVEEISHLLGCQFPAENSEIIKGSIEGLVEAGGVVADDKFGKISGQGCGVYPIGDLRSVDVNSFGISAFGHHNVHPFGKPGFRRNCRESIDAVDKSAPRVPVDDTVPPGRGQGESPGLGL